MINMRLAKERGLVGEEIEAINSIHAELENLLETAYFTKYHLDVECKIEDLEFHLQRLWGFPVNRSYHTWGNRYKFKCQWAGRKFRCAATGEEFTIPNSVEERDYFGFGESAIDVGRLDSYFRVVGDVVEITEEGDED